MPRPRKEPAEWTVEISAPTEGIDDFIREATREELSEAVIAVLVPGWRADIFAHILQGRVNRVVAPAQPQPSDGEPTDAQARPDPD